MASIVTSGIYMGRNLQQMEAELARYMEAVDSSGSDVASVSFNGDSTTFGPRRDMNLREWQEAIQLAFYMLGDTRFDTPATNAGAVRIY